MKMPDIRMRSQTTTVNLDGDSSQSDQGLLSPDKHFLVKFTQEIISILSDPHAKKIFVLLALNILCTIFILIWCQSTSSMALTAYAYLTIFDVLRLMTSLVSLWVSKQQPTAKYSFGYQRFEVLAVFASTLLAQFGGLFVLKECFERMLQQPEIYTSRLLLGAAVGMLCHIIVTYSVENRAFNEVIKASSSSWLQEHLTDISEGICHIVPGLSKILLPRVNPFVILGIAGMSSIGITYILIDINSYYSADTWTAIWICVMTWGTMFPMSIYSGKILLQTTPAYIIGQLDKCIREASTIDGVLEFRNEHFWTLAFTTMVGSVHVRIRRDADEQIVLSHVFHRLNSVIHVLTVQVFKDDWTRPSSTQILSSALSGGLVSPGMGASGADRNHSHQHHHQHSHQHSIAPMPSKASSTTSAKTYTSSSFSKPIAAPTPLVIPSYTH